MLIINGTEDPLVPFDGGDIQIGNKKYGKLLSTARSVEIWTKNNQVSFKEEKFLPDNDPGDGCQVKETLYASSESSIEVIVLTIRGGGHTWPGGKQYLPERFIGKTCRDFNACEYIWLFFRKHQKEK